MKYSYSESSKKYSGKDQRGMRRPKILIAEDDSSVARDIEKRLMNLGYDVDGIVSTGDEAIEKAIGGSPDVILMNVRLK
jgi:CheY-like chemotaxis protein